MKAYQISEIKQSTQRTIRKIVFFIFLTMAVLMAGCAKCEPQIITRTEYKEVSVPVKCQVLLPAKPKFKEGDLASAKLTAMYYAEVEALLKECVNE